MSLEAPLSAPSCVEKKKKKRKKGKRRKEEKKRKGMKVSTAPLEG
jgi:hypothetical protein